MKNVVFATAKDYKSKTTAAIVSTFQNNSEWGLVWTSFLEAQIAFEVIEGNNKEFISPGK